MKKLIVSILAVLTLVACGKDDSSPSSNSSPTGNAGEAPQNQADVTLTADQMTMVESHFDGVSTPADNVAVADALQVKWNYLASFIGYDWSTGVVARPNLLPAKFIENGVFRRQAWYDAAVAAGMKF